MLGSLRAYAKHRKESGLPGQSLAAVQKALASGRIKSTGDKIDFAQADRDWHLNTNVKQQRRPPSSPPPSVRAHQMLEEDKSYLEAQRQLEWIKVQKENLELQKRRREVLEKTELQESLGQCIIAIRQKAEAVPETNAERLAMESDPVVIREILAAEMHALLSDIIAWRPAANA